MQGPWCSLAPGRGNNHINHKRTRLNASVNILCHSGTNMAGAFMRALSASAMLFGVVLSAPIAQAEPLPAGKPAGVREAVFGTTGMILLVSAGVAVIVVTAGIAWGGGSKSSSGT